MQKHPAAIHISTDSSNARDIQRSTSRRLPIKPACLRGQHNLPKAPATPGNCYNTKTHSGESHSNRHRSRMTLLSTKKSARGHAAFSRSTCDFVLVFKPARRLNFHDSASRKQRCHRRASLNSNAPGGHATQRVHQTTETAADCNKRKLYTVTPAVQSDQAVTTLCLQ